MVIFENINVYRVYVLKQRKGRSEIIKSLSTETPFFTSACQSFWELYKLPFDKNYLILMTKNNKQINAYRYESIPGELDYFDNTMSLNDGND